MKGFNFIYKEHQINYKEVGKLFEAISKLLEKNAKSIKSFVTTGKVYLKNEKKI